MLSCVISVQAHIKWLAGSIKAIDLTGDLSPVLKCQMGGQRISSSLSSTFAFNLQRANLAEVIIAYCWSIEIQMYHSDCVVSRVLTFLKVVSFVYHSFIAGFCLLFFFLNTAVCLKKNQCISAVRQWWWRAFQTSPRNSKSSFSVYRFLHIFFFFPKVVVTDWFPRGLRHSTDRRAVRFLL